MDVALEFCDEQITAWGGLGLMRQMLDHLQLPQMLRQAGLPAPRSGRGYAPEQLVMQFLLSIWCGGNRFAHAEVTRFDPVLGQLFGLRKRANFKALMRLLDKFDQPRNEAVFGHIYRWLFRQLRVDNLTLDLDSTVMTRYGKPEGAAKGYNPSKPGRLSHHPLMAFVADTRMMANCWLRPGNSASANNAQAFLASTLEHAPSAVVCQARAHRPGAKQASAQAGYGDAAQTVVRGPVESGQNFRVAGQLRTSLLLRLRLMPLGKWEIWDECEFRGDCFHEYLS